MLNLMVVLFELYNVLYDLYHVLIEPALYRQSTEELVEVRRDVDHALAQTERPYRIYCKCK